MEPLADIIKALDTSERERIESALATSRVLMLKLREALNYAECLAFERDANSEQTEALLIRSQQLVEKSRRLLESQGIRVEKRDLSKERFMNFLGIWLFSSEDSC